MTEVASILCGQEAVSTAVSLHSTNTAQGACLAMGSGTGSGSAEALLLTATTAGVASVQGGGMQTEREAAVAPTGSSDLGHVLTGLRPSGALGSVLHTQTHLAEDQLELGMMASGDVSADPESLRFQYPIEEPQASKKKTTLAVYREQDRFLPINNVSRVMRNAIPRTGKVSKDAKECMQECVSEFISFITSEAADRCSQEKRKTLTGDDILFAMATLGFDNYIEPMKLYLQKIREYTKLEKVVPASRGREMASHNLSASPPAEHEAAATLDMEPMQTSPVTTPYTPMEQRISSNMINAVVSPVNPL